MSRDKVDKMILYDTFREGRPSPTLADLKDLVRMSWAWNSASATKLPEMKDLTSDIWFEHATSDSKRPLLASLKDLVGMIWDDAVGKKHTQDEWFHTRSVTACAFSPDGRFMVSASYDEPLKIWDATSGAECLSLIGHLDQDGDDFPYKVNALAFSPDGRLIVSASDDHTLKVWDAASGVERFTLSGHASKVNSCAVHPDGQLIVSTSSDHTRCFRKPACHLTTGALKPACRENE